MRRVRAPAVPTPERLCRFVAGEWPATGDERGMPTGWRAWCLARHAWALAHPDGLLGDFLDAMKAEIVMGRDWLANNNNNKTGECE